ncbi:hypothetical protein CR513_11505, partial [Mucuna pruriens]
MQSHQCIVLFSIKIYFSLLTFSASTPLKALPCSLVKEPRMTMDFEQHPSDFGMLYYRSLLQGKGILYDDQQLMEGKEPNFVPGSDELSDLQILILPMVLIRLNCSNVA